MDITFSVLICIALAVIYWLSYNQEQARIRDTIRLADIKQVQTAFELMYKNVKTYAPASCQVDNLVSQCDLEEYLPTIKRIKDPEANQYVVKEAPNNSGYAISFFLEGSYGNLGEGEHILSEEGIE